MGHDCNRIKNRYDGLKNRIEVKVKASKVMDMTKGPIGLPMIRFCVPIMLTSILQLLFNAADIVVVGNFVNGKAVAAVGACSYLINLLINLFVGISLGATVTIANYIGAKKTRSCHDWFIQRWH
jgi:Na+-driven multidrug efflux pump